MATKMSANEPRSDTGAPGGLLDDRSRSVASNLSVSFESEGGLHMVAGRGCYLYDAAGAVYLDAVNNVAHVGHSNAHVNRRMQEQQNLLNTNTRYLSAGLNAYTRRLLDTFPAPLSEGRCFLVNSGSEANDLAMRICRAHAHARRTSSSPAVSSPPLPPSARSSNPKDQDVFICLSYGYHGATDSVVDISPYKYRGRGGRGKPPNTIEVALPESEEEQEKELARLQNEVDQVIASGRSICGFFAETVLVSFSDDRSCAGQVWVPALFLQRIYSIVHRAGGLCVADEVQTGFGRLGGRDGSLWGFCSQGVVPDLVTLGKPMGNGYPLAGVVGSPAALRAFEASGIEYFNSCAGTNTAAAVGMAVLDCIEQGDLVQGASRVGEGMLRSLRALATQYPIVHEVRGQGLFLGIEIRLPPPPPLPGPPPPLRSPPSASPTTTAAASSFATVVASAAPPPALPFITLSQSPRRSLPRCASLSNGSNTLPRRCCGSLTSGDVCSWLCTALMLCRPMGVLVGSDGPLHNVVKIKPPMVFNERDAEYFVACFRVCLEALRSLHPCCFSNTAPPPPPPPRVALPHSKL